jgi:hypothetical protein
LYICISNPDIHENIYERDKNIFIPHIESPAIFQDEELILSIVQNVKLETIIEIDETYKIYEI